MVITFLIALMLVEIVGGVLMVTGLKKDGEASAMAFGWALGAATSATAYVLFYQIFPVVN